jgi:hypothetical protein
MDLLKFIKGNLDAMLAKQDCAEIFGKAPGRFFGTSDTPTAEQVLDSLIDGNSSYGRIEFKDPSDGSVVGGLLGGHAGVTIADHPFLHALVGSSSASTIYISTLSIGESFNTSVGNAETTILHELGHLLSNLNWKGSQIKGDANNMTQSAANDALIQSKCGIKP